MADYQSALRSVEFHSTNTNPPASEGCRVQGERRRRRTRRRRRRNIRSPSPTPHPPSARAGRSTTPRATPRRRFIRPDGQRAGGRTASPARRRRSAPASSRARTRWLGGQQRRRQHRARRRQLDGADDRADGHRQRRQLPGRAARGHVRQLERARRPRPHATVTFSATDEISFTGDGTRTIAVTRRGRPAGGGERQRDGPRGRLGHERRRARERHRCGRRTQDDRLGHATRRTARSCSRAARRGSTRA